MLQISHMSNYLNKIIFLEKFFNENIMNKSYDNIFLNKNLLILNILI